MFNEEEVTTPIFLSQVLIKAFPPNCPQEHIFKDDYAYWIYSFERNNICYMIYYWTLKAKYLARTTNFIVWSIILCPSEAHFQRKLNILNLLIRKELYLLYEILLDFESKIPGTNYKFYIWFIILLEKAVQRVGNNNIYFPPSSLTLCLSERMYTMWTVYAVLKKLNNC